MGGGVVSSVDSYAIIESERNDYGYPGTANMRIGMAATGSYSEGYEAIWEGYWEGAFFGNPAPGAAGADKLPGSVAGAFGIGVGAGRREHLVGTFAAHRTGWTDAPEGVRQ